MAKYRKKPVVIEAVQWTGKNIDEIKKLKRSSVFLNSVNAFDDKLLVIATLEGNMKANIGDYVIKGVQGELYPCKPDIFHATYDKV